jgi:hypothetical protein
MRRGPFRGVAWKPTWNRNSVHVIAHKRALLWSFGADVYVTSSVSNDVQTPHDFCSTSDTAMLVGCTNERFNRSTLGVTSNKEIARVEIDK